MKKLYPILFFILLIIIGCSSGGGTTGTGGYRYSGTVLNDSGNPLSGVNVTLEELTGIEIKSTTTATDGTFEFTDIDTSDAVIQIDKGKPTASEIPVSIPKDKNEASLSVKKRPDGKYNNDDIKYENRPRRPDEKDDNKKPAEDDRPSEEKNPSEDDRPSNSGKKPETERPDEENEIRPEDSPENENRQPEEDD